MHYYSVIHFIAKRQFMPVNSSIKRQGDQTLNYDSPSSKLRQDISRSIIYITTFQFGVTLLIYNDTYYIAHIATTSKI